LNNPAEEIPHAPHSGPLVTIAMPVYNAGRYLRPAVMSILQQTFSDWELIVIDDGSSDGAVEGIRDLPDARIRVLRDDLNKGLAARLNEAIDLARGRFFARMDQDDVSYPERLARQVTMLESNAAIDLCAVRCVTIDTNDELVGAMPYAQAHDDLCARPWAGFYLPHPTWCGRIEWFRRHRYATPGPYFCEDQELLLRSYRHSQFATVGEVLFAYRVRNRINWEKAVRTRKTLARLQLRNFFSSGQYWPCFLAASVFVIRIAMDGLNALVQNVGGRGLNRQQAVGVTDGEALRWHEVSNQLVLAGKRFE